MISSRKIVDALVGILEKEKPGSAADALVSFLRENHLISMLPNIISSLEKKSLELEKIGTAHVTLSHKVKSSTIKDIEKIITKSPDDDMSVTYDSDLIGGFLARYRGKEYDGSIKGQLRELKAALMK